MIARSADARLLLWRRAQACAVFVAVVLHTLGGQPAGAAQAVSLSNPFNDDLLKLSPEDRAAKLAAYLGFWCIGSKPFLMGVTQSGPAMGYAYWSLECAGANSYVIQISPNGKGAAMECRILKENGDGRECYKTF
jgi:hypothetical protein